MRFGLALSGLIFAALTFAGCSGGGDGPNESRIGKQAAALKQAPNELQRMRDFVRDRVDPATVRKSLRTSTGRRVDCVDINAQPALKNPRLKGHIIQSPPSIIGAEQPAAVPGNGLAHPEPLFEIGTENQTACSDGTVPIPQVTVEDLMQFSTLEQFQSKSGTGIKAALPSTAPGVARRTSTQGPNISPPSVYANEYAHAYQLVTNWGAEAYINIWTQFTDVNEFSLGQLWLSRIGSAGAETVEAGVNHYYNLNGDNFAHLFVYSTRDDYISTGCYNLNCGEFVQTHSSIYPGVIVGPSSIYNGTQYDIYVHWAKAGSSGDWWLSVNNQWVGYYPRALFSSTGLQSNAAKIDFGGEVTNASVWNHSSSDMGSGQFSSAWWQHAAYMRMLRYNDSNPYGSALTWAEATNVTPTQTNANCYDVTKYPITNISWWNTHFFYGGPGFSASCN